MKSKFNKKNLVLFPEKEEQIKKQTNNYLTNTDYNSKYKTTSNYITKSNFSTETKEYDNYLDLSDTMTNSINSDIHKYKFQTNTYLPKKESTKKKLNKSVEIYDIMDIIKQSRENERQKKIYEQKLKAVKLRIKNLKNKKKVYYKQKKNESIKEKNINEIKENKNNLRNSINIINEDKKREILKKYKRAKEEKYKIEMGIKNSKIKAKTKKKIEYYQIKTEKNYYDSIILTNNFTTERYNQQKVKNIKEDRNKIKINEKINQKNLENEMKKFYNEKYEHSKNETEKLKEEIKKLEKIENSFKEKMKKENINLDDIKPKKLQFKPKTKSIRSRSTIGNQKEYLKPFIVVKANHKDDFYFTHRFLNKI